MVVTKTRNQQKSARTNQKDPKPAKTIYNIFYKIVSVIDKAEKIPRMIVNVIVTQHHRRPSSQIPYITQTGLIRVCCRWFWVVLAGFVGGFG